MTRKIKTDLRFRSTAQLEKQVAKELAIPDPSTPLIFDSKGVKWGSDNFKDEEEDKNKE
tara:strand:+ start:366 stop:542 length:177 start_codon:yes stop_codon:yes gene_type:complete